jgi:ATP-dependent helicase/nuclease subunit A
VAMFGEESQGWRYPKTLPAPKPPAATTLDKKFTDAAPLPGPLWPGPEIETIRPSLLKKEGADLNGAPASSVEKTLDASAARQRGTALHALLQHLAPLAPEKRAEAAGVALGTLLPSDPDILDPDLVDPNLYADLTKKALAILKGRDSDLLFGVNSRAELPVFVHGTMGNKPIRVIGRIDRVIVEENKVLVVDFKSDAQPALNCDEVSMAYLKQLGIYLRACEKLFPDVAASAAIYWTSNETLMRLPYEKLLQATQEFKLA